MAVMEHTETVTEWLSEHPRTMGALWMLMLLLAESGNVIASAGNAKAGP